MEIVFGVIALGIGVILAKSVRIIGQAEVIVVERLGRFNRVARSGLNLLIPFVERARSIDVRFFRPTSAGSTSSSPPRPRALTCASRC